MSVKITNIIENDKISRSKLEIGHGNSFLIEIQGRKIMFDAGPDGKKLLHNLNALKTNPNDIELVVLSHGHYDHTIGLPTLVESRTKPGPLPVIAHPNVMERKVKKGKKGEIKDIGFPKVGEAFKKRTKFIYKSEKYEIVKDVFITGEIKDRFDKTGTEDRLLRDVEGKFGIDPLIDDLSLVIKTKEGLVVVCGCCHSGLINTCAKIASDFDQKIIAIIGGTHMLRFGPEDINHVAQILQNIYGKPRLYLNHCTGKQNIQLLKEKFGDDIVHSYPAGSELIFESV
ncbi:MAG: MBL fold metallo-hydrolase [Candidatus Hodarchaeota archaeon]